MKIEDLRIGMEIRHPQYGIGTVKSISETSATVQFNDSTRELAPGLSDIQPAEATATLAGMTKPLPVLVEEIVQRAYDKLDLNRPDELVKGLGAKWRGGTLVLKPTNASLQPKEVPVENFFHKIVMMRNNLRLLEQKVNGSEALSSAEKFDLQQYVTRCYGSMTTFNVLFKDKEDFFTTKGE